MVTVKRPLFYPLTSVTESELRAAAWVSSLADPTPEGEVDC